MMRSELSSKATKMPGSFERARAIDQRLQRQDRLARARAAFDQRRPPAGQAASGDFVETR